MLTYAFIFLVVALIAAALGFEGVAGLAFGAARFLFLIFLVVFIALLILGLTHSAAI